MFVMNFGAGTEDPYTPAVIPNDVISDAKGFPGIGMPLLWLLNANEGETVYQARQYSDPQGNIHNILLTGKRVNYLHGYAHLRDVYSAVVVPGTQLLGQNSLAETFGPIWDVNGLPVIEINARAVEASVNGWNSVGYNYDLLHALACVIAHELGHTILWDVDHNRAVQDGQDPMSILTNGDYGHHVYQEHRMRCFMWPYFPPGYVPDLDGDRNPESLPFPNLPTDFCDSHQGASYCGTLIRSKGVSEMTKVKLGQKIVALTAVTTLTSFIFASPPGGRIYPKANEEATEKLKEAYAAYYQGWYDRAISLAMDVYRKYGDVHDCWWPTWVKRLMKGELPDPHGRGAILKMTVEGRAPLTMMLSGTTTVALLSYAYLEAGRYQELVKAPWGDPILQGIASLKLRQGKFPPQPPPKNTWRPLPLKFREEDYFILVPLDEACKVLGIAYRLDISPKTKRVRYVFWGEKGKLYPGLTQARDLSGRQDFLAYAPYEENGVVWVPFYWLAKQAGIKGWEVRNGKIYVAPK